jgi:anti-anti-sigma regulatory factor
MEKTDSPTARLLVLTGQRFACVKIIGRATLQASLDFRTLLSELLGRGYACFVFDLSECTLMDSTFLGILAGFALKLRRDGPTAADLTLLNPTERVLESLENLGLTELFRVARGSITPPEPVETRTAASAPASREELAKACLEAHETLMALKPENVARFKDVARFLAEELTRKRES